MQHFWSLKLRAEAVGFVYSNQGLCEVVVDMKTASLHAQRFGVTKAQDPVVLSALIKVKTSELGCCSASRS